MREGERQRQRDGPGVRQTEITKTQRHAISIGIWSIFKHFIFSCERGSFDQMHPVGRSSAAPGSTASRRPLKHRPWPSTRPTPCQHTHPYPHPKEIPLQISSCAAAHSCCACGYTCSKLPSEPTSCPRELSIHLPFYCCIHICIYIYMYIYIYIYMYTAIPYPDQAPCSWTQVQVITHGSSHAATCLGCMRGRLEDFLVPLCSSPTLLLLVFL